MISIENKKIDLVRIFTSLSLKIFYYMISFRTFSDSTHHLLLVDLGVKQSDRQPSDQEQLHARPEFVRNK